MSKLKKILRSFFCALNGIRYAAQGTNFQIEIIGGCIAIALAFMCNISGWETAVLVLTILLVLILEIINTIFERIIDILKPRMHPYAKVIKDMMAGVVLLACLSSLVVGAIIFLPYIKI